MKLKGDHLAEVFFPVGGIGAGCIGISGSGRLDQWEIFNRPGKQKRNGRSHFAVRVERDGKVEEVRILNSDLTRDLAKDGVTPPSPAMMCGFPHFRSCSLDGRFPVAEFHFEDPDFPGRATLTAWSPFVPGESDLASMPCAMFELAVENTSQSAYDCTFIGVLENAWGREHAVNEIQRNGSLTHLVLRHQVAPDDFEYGELALTTDADDLSCQQYLYRGGWFDTYEVYAKDLFTPGKLKERTYVNAADGVAMMGSGNDAGLLAGHRRIEAGQTASVRFILSWFVPNCQNENRGWCSEDLETELRISGVPNRWKNYYASLCRSAAAAAETIFSDYDRIRQQVFLFRDTLHATTISPDAREGAAANLAVLISPTCLRLEDGTFWGWEGVMSDVGACHGSCQHVWNYAQALPLLFPDLERSMRESHFKYGFDENGGLHFRVLLPLGIHARKSWFRPCVDGSFGEVMKAFRDWKISGDGDWIKKVYPSLKKILEYTWSPTNPDRWDPEQTGLLSGRQHHTLDMELFTPSGWLEGHYLGALKACGEIAEYCEDPAFAALCRKLFERGRRAAEAELFNGEYYIQKIDLADPSVRQPYLAENESAQDSTYWDAEHGELKYQIGEGCSIDSHLGPWYASLYGLGEIFSEARVRSTLLAIYRYNFQANRRNQINTWRIFSLNDEGGTVICTWPNGVRKPAIPLPYNSETMSGFEWAAASHLIMQGETAAGEAMIRAIRARYNGANRNPWNEMECGGNYARSMASYSVLQAYSGFRYDMSCGRIGFAPVKPGDFRCFWSLGSAWGEYERIGNEQRIRILHGAAEFREFDLAAETLEKNGQRVASHRRGSVLVCPVAVRVGDLLSFR